MTKDAGDAAVERGGALLENAAGILVGDGQSGAPAVSLVVSTERPGDSFEAFFQAEYPRLLKAMYLATGDRNEAEELAQETFVKALERWQMISRAQNRPGYLYRMAINLYRSRLRRMARLARKALQPPEPPDEFGAADDRDAIGRALAALPDGQRQAVVMVEWLGMSHEEAGAALGISPVTVRVRIHRARGTLRPLLRPVEPSPEDAVSPVAGSVGA